MHAIAHRVSEERPAARIIYVSAERFTNDFIGAIQHHRMDEFRAKYRSSCDLLLVDDIQFLAGREQTQEEFFHTFNALHTSDRQIVVTSDKYPQNLERMADRLVSRFSWGLVADIQVPELETRVAIVRNKAAQEAIVMGDDVALYLAQVDLVERARAGGDADPARGEVVAHGAACGSRVREGGDERDGARGSDERGGHPAGRLPPLPPALDGPHLEGPAQERGVRAARGDVPVQAAAEVLASPRSGARSATAITRR
jgi:hypothetical protein